MNYYITALRSYLEGYEPGAVQRMLDSFSCGMDDDRVRFLREKAVHMENMGMSRTYLAMSEDDGFILGYFTLGMKCTRVPEDSPLSKTARDKMNMDSRTMTIQSYLIGQLARDDGSPKGFGGTLIKEALAKLSEANRIVGCKVVRVDCREELRKYYEGKGFRFVSMNPEGDLCQMVMVF